jgi:hypothetical protein
MKAKGKSVELLRDGFTLPLATPSFFLGVFPFALNVAPTGRNLLFRNLILKAKGKRKKCGVALRRVHVAIGNTFLFPWSFFLLP